MNLAPKLVVDAPQSSLSSSQLYSRRLGYDLRDNLIDIGQDLKNVVTFFPECVEGLASGWHRCGHLLKRKALILRCLSEGSWITNGKRRSLLESLSPRNPRRHTDNHPPSVTKLLVSFSIYQLSHLSPLPSQSPHARS